MRRISLKVGERSIPSQPGRPGYFDWLVHHGSPRDQALFERFLATLEAEVPKAPRPKAPRPATRRTAAQDGPVGAQLDALLTGLAADGDLAGYAAHDGLKAVVANWKAALKGGEDLANLVGDLDALTDRIAEFKASVQELTGVPPAPRR